MDITTYALLKKKIDSLGISDAKILEVVETFLLAHPEYIGATDEQVAQIVANAAAIQELQADAVTIVTLDEYNALSETEKKKRDYLIYSEEEVLIDEVLDENSTRPVQNKVITKEINEIKKSVSDGKEMLAEAITGKGVETASDDAFHVMAENVKKIESGGGTSFDRVIVSLDRFMINTSELGCRVIVSLDKFMINTSAIGCNVYLGEEE